MSGFDVGAEATSVLVWAAGGLAALLVVAMLAALWRGRFGAAAILLALALALGGAGAWLLRDQFRAEDHTADRLRLAQRADELAARALAPSSPLACLDAPAGQTVETACEALVFGRPETIAAAVSYVAARLALLSEAAALPGGGAEGGETLTALRRDLAADRFGIVAQVLSAKSACVPDRCPAFALVADAQRIQTNMREGTFDRLVARHAGSWPSERDSATAATAASKGAPASQPRAVARPLSPGQDFPSAASIPPVSIMTAEPPRAPEPNETDNASAAQASVPSRPVPVPLPRPAPRSASRPVSIAPQPSPSAGSPDSLGQD